MKTENFQTMLRISTFCIYRSYCKYCIICKFFFYFLRICFILGYPYSFRYLVIVSFSFTVYDIIYIIKKKKYFNPDVILWGREFTPLSYLLLSQGIFSWPCRQTMFIQGVIALVNNVSVKHDAHLVLTRDN